MRYRISFEMDTDLTPGPEVWHWRVLLEDIDDSSTNVDFDTLKIEGTSWEELEYYGN